jgi:ABC-2 type transport system permease protein
VRVWIHVFHLGLKELVALRHDPVLMLFIVYAFSLDVVTAVDQSIQVRNASVAIVDEDQSPLSRRLYDLYFPPHFQAPAPLAPSVVDDALNAGRYTFVVDVPPKFQEDLRAGRDADLQINVDATAVAQAFTGSYYIQQIVEDEVARYLELPSPDELAPVKAVVRIKYNQNAESSWFLSVAEMLQMITVLTMLLPAAALIREQEHGTIEHLLVMPLLPAEIMLAKVWASALVVQVGTVACWYLILDAYLGVPLRGSLPLFLFGTFVYQFTITAIGMFLATLVRTVAQFVLLLLLVITPMIFLSGIFTPIESMPELLKRLMVISPMRYYVEFAYAVIVREAGLVIVARDLLAMVVIGVVSFAVALVRFRGHFAAAASR